MHIIPAIDLIGGKCVRLSQGDYSSKKEYHDDPLEMAKRFEGAGISRLHLVDLDGAKAKKIVNEDVLERICSGTSLSVDFGGGIQADEEIEKAFALDPNCQHAHLAYGWIQIILRNKMQALASIEKGAESSSPGSASLPQTENIRDDQRKSSGSWQQTAGLRFEG